jgi:hypothetical protein
MVSQISIREGRGGEGLYHSPGARVVHQSWRGIEVVMPPSGADLNWFSYVGPKGLRTTLRCLLLGARLWARISTQ